MSTNLPRSCPYCGGWAHPKTLHRQRFFPSGITGAGYRVVVCELCGGAFADDIPPQQILDEYYSLRSKYALDGRSEEESIYDLNRFEVIAEQIEKHVPKNARILDIGCANGGLLSRLRKIGYKNISGLDPSAACAANAQRFYDISVRTGAIGNLKSIKERFDLVLLVGVLEHIRELQDALALAKSILDPGGFLYCAQPDVTAFPDLPLVPFQQFSTEHINYFSAESMGIAMATAGLRVTHSWRWIVEWRKNAFDSVLSVLCQCREGPAAASGRDEISEKALHTYVDLSNRADDVLREQIQIITKSEQYWLVWGVGTMTRHLLAEGILRAPNIIAFIDSNPHLQNQDILGIPVIAPCEVRALNHPILISSVVFQNEIVESIRGLNLRNPVFNLRFSSEPTFLP